MSDLCSFQDHFDGIIMEQKIESATKEDQDKAGEIFNEIKIEFLINKEFWFF